MSKKIDDIFRKKSNPCQVDINQENSSDEMTTISAKGLKKKQGCKGRRRIKSCLEKPKKKKKRKHPSTHTNKSVFTGTSLTIIIFNIYTASQIF